MGTLTTLERSLDHCKAAGAHRGPLIGRSRKAAVRVQGIVPERVVLSTELDPYLSLRALSGYSGLSIRKLRTLLADPANPLPHYRIGSKIVVRRSEYDAWTAQFKAVDNQSVDTVVAEVLAGLAGPRLSKGA